MGFLRVRSRSVRDRPGVRARPAPVLVAGALGLAVGAVWAQESGLSITSSFSATQLFTDNHNLSATDPQAESITVLTPSVQITSRSGPLKGSLSYGLSGVIYGRNSSASGVQRQNQNALSAAFNFEVIEQHGYIDVGASISQQSVSALGLQSSAPTALNANSTELRTFSLAPSWRGRLFGEVDVVARVASSISSSADNRASDSSSHNGSLTIGNSSRALGWSLAATRSISDFEGGRRTAQDRLNGQVSYTPDPGLRFFVNAGTESNDVLTIDQRAYDTWGGGASWQPTPRTQFSLQGERRYFGNSHSFSFSHRMRRSVVSYTDSRSVSESAAGAGFTLSVYELFFGQFASLEPDPVLRDVLVRNFLQAAGLDPNQRLSGGFLNAALTVQASRNLSLALQGQRSNLVLTAFTTSTRRADAISTAQDDLSRVGVLRQQGWSLSLSRRLSPTSSAVLSLSEQRTPGRGAVAGNGLRSVNLGWSSQLAQRASLSLTARHSRASGANEYRENNLSAAFNLSF